MARRAALIAFAFGLVSCGSNDGGGNTPWTCTWRCNSNDPPTSGTQTYPAGANPTAQCNQQFGTGCSNFTCSCTQN